MKALFWVIILVVVMYFVGSSILGTYFAVPESPAPTEKSQEPIVTIMPTDAPAPVAMMTPMPTLTRGGAERIKFPQGSYGTTVTVNGRQSFVFWAARGQTLTLTGGIDSAQLTAPDGSDVTSQTLPASGDYLLLITGNGQVGIEIR